MEKLIYTYLLLAILTVLDCWRNFAYTNRKGKTTTVTPIFNLVYSGYIVTRKHLISPHITDNQCEFFISPIQLPFCPILQNTCKSTFAE